MDLELDVFAKKWRRVVMVRFERGKTGDPEITIPEPDDRGYAVPPEHAAIFGVCQGDTVTVRLRRERIAKGADLFVKSSDTSIFTVEEPATGLLLGTTETVDIKIKGVGGGTPKKAKLEVRFASSQGSPLAGPIIHEAAIFVWHPIQTITITPHLVTIERAGAPAPRPSRGTIATVASIINVANAIWRPCGLTFTAAATQAHTIALATEGVVDLNLAPGGEVDQVLALGNVPHTVNAYFINTFSSGGTLGLGISPATQAALGLGNPGIILADETTVSGTTIRHDTQWSGNDLAHEIGHFLGLRHVENQNADNPRQDTWARRMLMHPTNLLARAKKSFQTDIGYGQLPLLGSNRGRRGALITQRHLAQLTTDNECTTARGNVATI